MSRALLVGGATGLVGAEVLRQAVSDPAWSRVTGVVRRLPEGADRRVTWCIADYERLSSSMTAFGCDVAVCALGTTLAQAGSPAAFRRVDFDYALALARQALASGARHLVLVSALGALATSRALYRRVKGEIEAAMSALPYERVTIVRPSLLVGERLEARPREALIGRLGRFLPRAVRPIPAVAVARAILREARETAPGRRIVSSGEMLSLPEA